MRLRDYPGLALIAAGLTGLMLGHHSLGLLWFWGGVVLAAVGLLIISTGGRQDEITQALRHYTGPGDGGSTDYHGGRDWHGHHDPADVD